MQEIAKKELQKLYEYEESLKDKLELLSMTSLHHNMFFRTAKDGAHQFFGRKKALLKIDAFQLFYIKTSSTNSSYLRHTRNLKIF